MMILAFALPVIAFNDDIVETRRMFPDAFEIRFILLNPPLAPRRFKKEALVGTLLEKRVGSVDRVQSLLVHVV